MTTVHKYELTKKCQKFAMPTGYKVLSVNAQQGKVCMWVQVDTSVLPNEVLTIHQFMTGEGFRINPDGLEFIGTYFLFGGSFVGHVFRELNF